MTTRILTWDWREQPDLKELARVVADVSGGTVHIHEVDTQSDQFAIAVSSTPLDEQQVMEAFDDWLSAESDEDGAA